MGMTIDKSMEVLADYIDTYKICGGNGYNPATNITQEACEAFEMAIDTMRKYQKIKEIVKKWELDSWTDNLSYESMIQIREVLEDGNDD